MIQLYTGIISCSASEGYVCAVWLNNASAYRPLSAFNRKSLTSLNIDVGSTKHQRTWWTAASTPQTLLVSSICGPPAAISCSYLDTGVPSSVVGPFLWPARQPGTRYHTTCEIRHGPLTAFAGTWKLLFFSRFTSVQSALEALRLCAI